MWKSKTWVDVEGKPTRLTEILISIMSNCVLCLVDFSLRVQELQSTGSILSQVKNILDVFRVSLLPFLLFVFNDCLKEYMVR